MAIAGGRVEISVGRVSNIQDYSMRLVILALSVILALGFSFFTLDLYWAAQFVSYAGYPILFATFSIFSFSLFKIRGRWGLNGIFDQVRSSPLPILTVGGCTGFLLLQEPFGFKILMDEVVLLGTSMSMHFEKAVLVPSMANDYEGSFRIIEAYLDKRPYFHPFLISLLHDLTGYRPINTFILNIILTPVMLALAYRFGHKLTSQRGGILSVLLLTSLPLLAQNAVGGHFEILNLVMILAAMLLGCRYLQKLDGPSLTAFCYAGLLLTQTRYEGVIFVIPIGLIVLLGWHRKGEVQLPWQVILAPLLLVCIPMQFFISMSKDRFWQLKDTGKDQVFSFRFFGDNLQDAGKYLFHYGQTNSNSLLLSLLGLVAVAYFLVYVVLRLDGFTRQEQPRFVLSFFLLAVLASFALAMGYHWGHLTDPVASRFCLPLLLVAALAVPVVLQKWPAPLLLTTCGLFFYTAWFHIMDRDYLSFIRSGIGIIVLFLLALAGTIYVLQRKRDPLNYLIGLSLLFIIFVTVPVASNHRYAGRYTPAKEAEMILEFFQQNPEKDYFFTSRSPLMAITHGISSASIHLVADQPDNIRRHFLHRNYSAFYAFQLVDVNGETGELDVVENYDLGPAFEIETVKEKRLIPLQMGRIVRFYPKEEYF